MPIPEQLALILETLLSRYVRLSPTTLTALNTLTNKAIQIDLAGHTFTALPDEQGILITADYHGTHDATITTTPLTLLRYLLQPNITLTDIPDIHLTGDTPSAQHLLEHLKNTRIDWEEQLAKTIGNIPAHALCYYLNQTHQYTTQRLTTLQHNTTEYLQEETRHLIPPPEMHTFTQTIHTLENKLNQLETRLSLLKNN